MLTKSSNRILWVVTLALIFVTLIVCVTLCIQFKQERDEALLKASNPDYETFIWDGIEIESITISVDGGDVIYLKQVVIYPSGRVVASSPTQSGMAAIYTTLSHAAIVVKYNKGDIKIIS